MSVDLEALYLEHEPRVRWIMHARGVDAGSVDDLVHESFVTIHRRWAQRDRSVPVATWVTGVARNVAFSFRRAEARRQRRLRAMPEPPTDPSPDQTVAEREAWRELEVFTRALSPKLREVFVLADVGGMPVNEIAETSGVPVATLHSRLRLARRRFEAHFDSRRGPEQRSAMLRRAADQQTPPPAARRRSLGLLMAAVKVPGTALVPLAAGSSGKVTGWVVAVVIAGIGGMVAIDQTIDRGGPNPARVGAAPERAAIAPDTEQAPKQVSASTTRHPSPVAVPDAPPPTQDAAASPANVDKHRPPTRAHDPTPEEVLAAHVAALEQARALFKSGSSAAALEALDRLEALSPALLRDHHRLALGAACHLGRRNRAKRAGRALARLGLPMDADEPCAEKPIAN